MWKQRCNRIEMAINASHEHLSFTPSNDQRAPKQQLGVENEMKGERGRKACCWCRHSCVELMCCHRCTSPGKNARGGLAPAPPTYLFSVLLPSQASKVLLELLQEDECEDGVRAEPDEGRNVALVEGQRALPQGEPDQVEGT